MASEISIFEDGIFNPPVQKLPLAVLPSLAESMKVTLVANTESRLWLIHDRPFNDTIVWAEYDIDSATLSLIMRDGRVQPLGLTIHPPARKVMRHTRQLFTMLVKDEQVHDSYILPLLVRETGYYKA
ncbi:MAG: hypothetical protein JWO78_604 [Micavibrio sp.]|nr:hypothetical protein [Micavibrio sp.]